MTTFTQQRSIPKRNIEVYDFLQDLKNHEQLMPEGGYSWTIMGEEVRLEIKNLTSLTLRIDEKVPSRLVTIRSVEGSFVPVVIRWEIEAQGEEMSLVTLRIDAQLNMMMKMVASPVLNKLVEYQIEKLHNIFS